MVEEEWVKEEKEVEEEEGVVVFGPVFSGLARFLMERSMGEQLE